MAPSSVALRMGFDCVQDHDVDAVAEFLNQRLEVGTLVARDRAGERRGDDQRGLFFPRTGELCRLAFEVEDLDIGSLFADLHAVALEVHAIAAAGRLRVFAGIVDLLRWRCGRRPRFLRRGQSE